MAKREVVVGFHVEGAETFQQKSAAASKAIKDVNSEIRKLDATYGKGSKNSDYLSQRSELLTQKLEAQRRKTEALRQGLEQYRNTEKASAAEIERRERQLKNCEIAEADLTRQIRECATAMKTSKSSFEESLAGLEKYEKKAQSVGNSLTRALTVPIAGMGTIGLKNVLEFEDAMKTVQTLPGVTSGTAEAQAAQLEAYSDAILDASNATRVAAEELAAAQYSAISSGVAAEESVYMVERSAKAAKAGLSDVETVVDGATSALNAWRDTAGGLDHVLDAMMVAQNVGKTNIDQLASSIGQVTGLAPQLGVSLDEVLASVAALTQGGVATSTAFNGLKAVMSNVLKPTAEAREEAERLGLEFDAAAMQAKGFTRFLESVMEATKGDAESLGRLFGSTEALSEIMALGTTQAETYADALNQIGSAAGAVDEAFAVRTASKAEQLSGSLNKLRNSGIELAENLFPAVEAGAEVIGGLADFVGDMDEGTQKALVNLLGIVAAAGPAVKITGGLVATGRTLLQLGSSLTKVMSGPWGWVTLGASGLALLGLQAKVAKDDFEALDKSVAGMKIEPDAEAVSKLTADINAAIAAAESEKQVTVTAQVTSDFSQVQAEADAIAAKLDAALQTAMENSVLNWEEYKTVTAILNGEMLPEAKEAQSDPTKANAARSLITAIDDANALLRALYTSGDSATEAEIAQLEALLEQIAQLHAEIAGLQQETAVLQGRADILNAWDKELTESDAYRVTAEGYGTKGTAAEALGGAIELRRQKLAALDALQATYYQEETEAVKAAGSAEESAAIQAAYDEKAAEVEARRAEADAEFLVQLQQLWLGHAQSTDENADFADELDRIGRLIDKALGIQDMSKEDWAAVMSQESGLPDAEKFDYNYVLKLLQNPEMNVIDYVRLGQAADAWKEKQYDKLEKALTELDWEGTDLDELFAASIPEGFDPATADVSRLSETFANYLRVLVILQDGGFALTKERMEPLTEGDAWQDYGEEAVEAAEEISDAASEAAQPDEAALRLAGVKAGAALASGIAMGTPFAVGAAAAMAAQVNAALAGMTPVTPGTGLTTAAGGAANLTTAARSAVGSVDNSIHVGIANARFNGPSDYQALVDKLNVYNKMKNAGVGNVTRG